MVDAPPTLVEAVAECIDPRWLVEPASGVLCLVEKMKKRANMRFEINDLPTSITAIHVEKVGHLPGARKNHLTRRCDYLLVALIGGQSHAVFVEMKTTVTHEDRPKEQLVRSLPILRYLQSMCRIEHGFSDSASRVAEHFWIVGEKYSERFDKQPVRANPRGRVERVSHKGVDIAMFVGPRMPFADLARPMGKGPRERRHA